VIWSRLWRAALWLAALSCAGCSVLLAYSPTDFERGDDLCQDDIDNDADGLLDCDDPSCGSCVASPRIACPDGWEAGPLPGASAAVDTCARTASPFDDCPSEPPAGAVVIAAEPGALAAATPLPLEVWLAPGEHVEASIPRPADGRVLVRGFCVGASVPVVRLTDLEPIPSGGELTLEHVVLSLPEGAAPIEGALHLRSSQVAGGSELSVSGGALEINGSEIMSVIRAREEIVEIRESRIAGLAGELTRATLIAVDASGPISLSGTLSALTADQLFVRCASIAIENGAPLILGSVVMAGGHGADALISVAPGAVFGSSVVIHDLVAIGASSACGAPADGPGLSLEGVQLDLERTWLEGVSGVGARLVDAVGSANDVTVRDVRRGSTGASIGISLLRSPTMTLTRARVASVGDRAIDIDGPATTANPELRVPISLRRVFIERVPADACEPAPCSPLRAGVFVARGVNAAIADLAVSDVDGCAFFVDVGTGVGTLSGRVERSRIAVCAPGSFDGQRLLHDLSLDAVEQPLSIDPALCVAPDCSP
jgi:hypothetical protein